jgi:hypothetical protein
MQKKSVSLFRRSERSPSTNGQEIPCIPAADGKSLFAAFYVTGITGWGKDICVSVISSLRTAPSISGDDHLMVLKPHAIFDYKSKNSRRAFISVQMMLIVGILYDFNRLITHVTSELLLGRCCKVCCQ